MLEDGRKVTPELFAKLLGEELAKVRTAAPESQEAAKLFERISATTVRRVPHAPAYKLID